MAERKMKSTSSGKTKSLSIKLASSLAIAAVMTTVLASSSYAATSQNLNVVAESSSSDTYLYAEPESMKAGVFRGEATGEVARDRIVFTLRNSAYNILKAVDNKTIKPGDSLAVIREKVPAAFKGLPGTDAAIIYNPEKPAEFSMCGTGSDTNKTLSESILYDSRINAFKTSLFNCTPNNTALEGTVSPMNMSSEYDVPQVTLRDGFEFPVGQSASPVVNKNSDVSEQLLKAGTDPAGITKGSSPKAAPVDSGPPAPIPWGGIIIAILSIVGVAVLTAVGFRIYNFRDKAMQKKGQRSQNVFRWNELNNRYDAIAKEWASYELDPVKILDFPLLSDMRESNTVAFHKAMRHASNLKPSDLKIVSYTDPSGSPFETAVTDLENAFLVAETEAKRVRWSNFSAEEQKRLQTAKNLLNLAMDGGATDSERQAAYKRMQKELEGLIIIPKQTVLALEKKVNLSITDGKSENLLNS